MKKNLFKKTAALMAVAALAAGAFAGCGNSESGSGEAFDASKEITVEKADDEVAAQLKLTGDQLVVVVRSLSFLNDTTLFQLTESYHRPDKFKFSDFARRQKIKLK